MSRTKNIHGNQFSKIINSEMVILTPITINNHFNNANYVTKVDHLCSERHTFNFLLKKVDFRGACHGNQFSKIINSEMVILTSSATKNRSNNAGFVTENIHLYPE